MEPTEEWFNSKIGDLLNVLFLASADDADAIKRFRVGYEKAVRVRKQAEEVMKGHLA